MLLPSILLFAESNMEKGRNYYERLTNDNYWYYDRGEIISNTLSYLKSAAKEGYGEACYYLGNMYSNGEYITRDYAIAMNMYKKALEFGYEKGNTEIGDMYFHGRGVKKNYPMAVKYYQKSMDNEISSGKHMLGVCYYHGYGVQADTIQAYTLLQRYLMESEGERDWGFGHPAFYILANFLADDMDLYVSNDRVLEKCVENVAMLLCRTNQVEYMQIAAELLYCNNGGTFTWYGISKWDGSTVVYDNDYRCSELLEYIINMTDDYPENYYMYAMRKLFIEGYSGSDISKPLEYLEIAANRGVDKASRMLINMYDKGIWLTKNPTIAKKYKELWMKQINKKSETERKILLDTAYRNDNGIYDIGDTYIYNGEKHIVIDCDCWGTPTKLLPLNYYKGNYYNENVDISTDPGDPYWVWIYMDEINKGLVREGTEPLNTTTTYIFPCYYVIPLTYSEYFRFDSKKIDPNAIKLKLPIIRL